MGEKQLLGFSVVSVAKTFLFFLTMTLKKEHNLYEHWIAEQKRDWMKTHEHKKPFKCFSCGISRERWWYRRGSRKCEKQQWWKKLRDGGGFWLDLHLLRVWIPRFPFHKTFCYFIFIWKDELSHLRLRMLAPGKAGDITCLLSKIISLVKPLFPSVQVTWELPTGCACLPRFYFFWQCEENHFKWSNNNLFPKPGHRLCVLSLKSFFLVWLRNWVIIMLFTLGAGFRCLATRKQPLCLSLDK